MVERAIAAGVSFAWVVGDSIYGVSAVEMALRRAGKGYVLGVSATGQFNSWGAEPAVAGTAAEIAGALDPSAWHRLSAGAGAKGERVFDWAYLELADLEADVPPGKVDTGLLCTALQFLGHRIEAYAA